MSHTKTQLQTKLELLFQKHFHECMKNKNAQSYTLGCIYSPRDYYQHYLSFQKVLPKNAIMHILEDGYILFGLPEMDEPSALHFLNQVQSAQRIYMGIVVLPVASNTWFEFIFTQIKAEASADLAKFHVPATFDWRLLFIWKNSMISI